MNKEMIVEMVRSEIKRQANADVYEALSHEAFDVFGYDETVTKMSDNPRTSSAGGCQRGCVVD